MPSDDSNEGPIIRLLAISKRNMHREGEEKTSSDFKNAYCLSGINISSTASVPKFPGSCPSLADEIMASKSSSLSVSSKSTEAISDIREIVKRPSFQTRMKECKSLSKDVAANLAGDFHQSYQREDEPLSEDIICKTVNIQRFQTDDDVVRQNFAIAESVVKIVIEKAQRLTNKINLNCKYSRDKATKEIQWPTGGEFNIALGAEKIEEYIKTCYFERKWTYCINLIVIRKDGSSHFYIYDVQLSIPTIRNPVAPCSVSIYFIYQVSHYLPRSYPVTATFVIEGSTRQHFVQDVPTFNIDWITHVLEAKYQLMQEVSI